MRTRLLMMTMFVVLLGPARLLLAVDLFVAANGNDAWSGRLAVPDKDGRDGPFASLLCAGMNCATQGRRETRPRRVVHLRSGTYRLTTALALARGCRHCSANRVAGLRKRTGDPYRLYPSAVSSLGGVRSWWPT